MIGIFPKLPKQLTVAARFEERANGLKSFFTMREMMIDFYEENQTELPEYLENWGFATKDQLPYSAFALTRRVIDRISMVYKRAPERRLINLDGEEIEDHGYGEMQGAIRHFNPMLKRVERYHNLLDNVILRPEYHVEEDEYRFYVETEFIPQFSQWDTLYPVGYHFRRFGPTPNNSDGEEYFIYIDDVSIFAHSGAPMDPSNRWALPNNPDMEHDYGLIPAVDFSNPPVTDYWGLGARSLVDANRQLIVSFLTTFYAHQFQSFDQPVIKGVDVNQLDRDLSGKPMMKIAPDEMWSLPTDGDAFLLNPNPRLIESAEWLERWLNMVLANYGVQASFREAGQPMSGFALLVKNLELLERRESDVADIYRPAEQGLYSVLAAMNEVHGTGYDMPLDAFVQVDFADPEFPVEPAEERAMADWKLNHNLITPIDLMMDENPDLDRESAEERLKDNQGLNNLNRSNSAGVFNRFAQRQQQNGALENG